MISKRLQYIVDIITYFDTIADIGTDHGYVAVEIVKQSKANSVIATDVSKMSLKKSEDYVKKNNLEYKVSTRLGDGMQVLNVDEADCIVIAGMGGVLISQIIENSYHDKFINKTPTFIFQPVQQAKELRYYLYENNFEISDEHIIEDNSKIYHIIISKKSYKKDDRYNNISKNKDIYMKYGIINIEKKSELLSEIIKKDINKIKSLIIDLKQKNVDDKHIELLSKKLSCTEDIYNDTWKTI